MKLLTLILTFMLISLASPSVSNAQHESMGKGYHNKSDYPKANYDSLYEAAIPLSQSEAGQDLLENCLKAYGGRESLTQINTLRFKYKLKALMQSDTIDVTRTFSANSKHRFDLLHSDGKMTSRFMIGDTVWNKTGDSTVVMDRNRTILEYFHYLSLSLPISISDQSHGELRYGTRAGDSKGYLYFRIEKRLIFAVGIDSETHLILSSEGVAIDHDLRLVFINLFKDHKLTDGFMAAAEYTFVSMGLKVGDYHLLGVEINPVLRDGYFAAK